MAKTEPIRILRTIARLNVGGPAIHVISLSERLARDRYQTRLVCGRVSPREGDMSYLASEKEIEPLVIGNFGREIGLLGDISALMGLRTLAKQFDPHIIHTHTAKAGALGRLAGMSLNATRHKRSRIRLVHTFHGHVFHSYFSPFKSLAFVQIERFLAKYTDRIIVVSPRQKKEICNKYSIADPVKVIVIPLGFDLQGFKGQRDSGMAVRKHFFPDAPDGICVVGIVGRLTRVKNHRMFLEAAKGLMEAAGDEVFRFLIVGGGELKEELMNYAKRLGISHAVVFAGWQKEMTAVYSAMDIVALTSLNEGTPVTLIEAMAAGKPVVATAVGGVPDLLGSIDNKETEGYKVAERGLLVPSAKPIILTKALLHLSKNREWAGRAAEKASQFACKQFSLERLVRDMESLYEELMS
jgi:glycosyltransferase involved in cell wall biosynthesis